MINCDEFHKFIDDYVYDEVSFFVKAQMDEHIASCPKCREEAEFLKEIKSTLYAMPRLEVDESFKAALNEKLDAAEKTVDRKRRRSFFRDWRTYSALAACLVLAFVVQSKVGDFYRHSTVDPVQIPAENVADIDLSEMQKTTDQDESYTVPQNAAVNEQKEAAAEAPQETNQKNIVRSAAKQTEKPVVTQKTERQEEKMTDAPKPTAAQPVKPKATVITEDQAVQDTVQSSAVTEGAENPTLADTGENGTVLKGAAWRCASLRAMFTVVLA